MEEGILRKRYEFSDAGKAMIDITVESINDLFNSFDKRAVYTRRELDLDFVEYIADCVKEIGKIDFEIKIRIEKEFNIIQEITLRKAVINHFSHLYSLEHKKIRTEFKRLLLLTFFGVFLAFVVNKFNLEDIENMEVWMRILSEGAVISVWVIFWEAISSLIFGFRPYYSKRKLYLRIVNAKLNVLNSITLITLSQFK